MSGPSKVIVLDPDPRAGRQVQLGFEREGIPAVAPALPTDPVQLQLPTEPSLVLLGASNGSGASLVRRTRELLTTAKADIPIIVTGHDLSRAELEAAGADEVVAGPVYLRDIVTLGRILRGIPGDKRGHLVGNLADTTGVLTLVRALCALGRSAVLTLMRGLRRGEIRFYRGEVTSAQVGLIHGQAALHQLLLWTDARFDFAHEDIVRRQQIPLSHDELFADAERFLEGVREAAGSLSPATVLEPDVQRIKNLGSEIPTEVHGVLRMFDGHRVLADILEDSPYRVFETLRVAQMALEADLLRPVDRQRPKTTWKAVLAIEEWLVGSETKEAVVERTQALDSAPQPSKKKTKASSKLRSKKAAADTDATADRQTRIDWGALVPRVVGSEVGQLSPVVPALTTHGEVELKSRDVQREKLEALMDTGKRDRIFPTDIGLEPKIIIDSGDSGGPQTTEPPRGEGADSSLADDLEPGGARRRKKRDDDAPLPTSANGATSGAAKPNRTPLGPPAGAVNGSIATADTPPTGVPVEPRTPPPPAKAAAATTPDSAPGASDEADDDVEQWAAAKARAEASDNAATTAFTKSDVDTTEADDSDEAQLWSEAKARAEAAEKADQEARAKADQEARDKAEQEARDKAEQEARAKAEQEARDKAEQEARAKAEQEARDKAEQEARDKAEQEARDKAEQEARDKAEQEARDKAEQAARDKAAPHAQENADADATIRAGSSAADDAKAYAARVKAAAEAKRLEAGHRATHGASASAEPGATASSAAAPTEPPKRPSLDAEGLVRQLVSEALPRPTDAEAMPPTDVAPAPHLDGADSGATTPFLRPEPEPEPEAKPSEPAAETAPDTAPSPRFVVNDAAIVQAGHATPSLPSPSAQAAPAQTEDEPSDGIIRSTSGESESARRARLRQVLPPSAPAHDGPELKETSGEVKSGAPRTAVKESGEQPSILVAEQPSILVADLAAVHAAASAAAAHKPDMPTADASSTEQELEVADVRKDAVHFTADEEAFFRSAESHTHSVPKVESFDDLDEGHEPPPTFWERVFGKKK